MKFYSEKLNLMFDSMDELHDAEAAASSVKQQKPAKRAVKADAADTATPTRKQLAAKVEAADNKLAQARADYDVALQQVEELSKKFLEQIDAIMNPAKDAIKKAETDRYEALKNFNDSFGAYQVSYTGDRAAQEMVRAISSINNLHRNIFGDLFKY